MTTLLDELKAAREADEKFGDESGETHAAVLATWGSAISIAERHVPATRRPISAELASQISVSRLALSLLAAVTQELRDAAVAFQGPTETPAEAGQRATRLRQAAELATASIKAVEGEHTPEELELGQRLAAEAAQAGQAAVP